MATKVAKEAFLPALKYGASSPTRCEEQTIGENSQIVCASTRG